MLNLFLITFSNKSQIGRITSNLWMSDPGALGEIRESTTKLVPKNLSSLNKENLSSNSAGGLHCLRSRPNPGYDTIVVGSATIGGNMSCRLRESVSVEDISGFGLERTSTMLEAA